MLKTHDVVNALFSIDELFNKDNVMFLDSERVDQHSIIFTFLCDGTISKYRITVEPVD